MQLSTAVWHTIQQLTDRRSRRSIVALMLLLGGLVSVLAARAITQADEARLRSLLDGNAAIVRSRVEQKTTAAVDVLRSVRPLWELEAAPTDDDFKRYVDAGLAQRVDGRTTYAGLTGLAFVRNVPADRAAAFARDHRSRYEVDVTDDRPLHIIDFNTSDSVIGTDLYDLPRRREALEAARDRGTPVASRWYVSVADLGLPVEQQRTMTLIVVPVYDEPGTPATVAMRRRTLIGWLVAPLFAHEVLDDLAANLPVNLRLYETATSAEPIAAVDRGATADRDHLRVEVLGQTWTMQIGLTDVAGRTVSRATSVLVAGVSVTMLLTALYWLTSRLGAQSESRATTATARLRERESYVRVIAERVPVGIADLDADGRILWANTQLAEVVGVTADGLVGLSWSELVHPEDRDAVRSAHAAAAADSGAIHVRHRLLGAEEDRWIEIAGAPTLDDDGDVVRIVAVVSDVSAIVEFEDRLRVAHDQAVEMSRLKSEFLANMSHEIRTPLNGVLGMAEVLARTDLDDAQRSKITTLRTAAMQLRDLLNDILDLSQLEAGHLQLDDVEFDPADTITTLAGVRASSAGSRLLDLHVDVDAALPARVRGPQLRLQQVLDNLLGNAVTFTSQGEVTLAAKVVERRPGIAWIRFAVTDTGVGISAAMIESVFDPFTQTDASVTRLHGGSGLGLAISRQLVEMMGGRLEVESTTHRGSRFMFTVPLEVVEDIASAVDAAAPRDGVVEGSPARLLVVEDNPINQEVARELLATLGYEVEVVDDGAAGVEAVRDGRFAAVLMDCQMPGMDGYEATAHIREHEAGRGRRTPIIAMTAAAMAGDRQRCLAAGMDDYIAKPVSADVLAGTLARWVGGRARDGGPGQDAGAGGGTADDARPPVLDGQILQQLAEVPGLFERSRTRFLAEGRDEIDELRRLADRGDLTGTRAAAHRLRGAALILGALRLGELLERIEDAAVDAPGTVTALLDSVDTAFAELRDALLTTEQQGPPVGPPADATVRSRTSAGRRPRG